LLYFNLSTKKYFQELVSPTNTPSVECDKPVFASVRANLGLTLRTPLKYKYLIRVPSTFNEFNKIAS